MRSLIMPLESAISITQEYNDKRRKGEIKALKTGLTQLDENIGGFDLNTIVAIAARPSVGKSTYLMMLREGLLRNNPDLEIVWLSFNLEMSTANTINRMICRDQNISLRELTSKDKPIKKEKLDQINKDYLNNIKNLPLYFVNIPLSYDALISQIKSFWETTCKDNKRKIFIYDIDHIHIVNSINNEMEDKKIMKLLGELNSFKKMLETQGYNSIGFILSQISNDIESRERLSKPDLHYPLLKDLYYGAGLQQYCDYILALYNPYKIHLKSYGSKQFPVLYLENGNTFIPLIYSHILKQRDGETSDNEIPMIGRLSRYTMEEIPRKSFYDMLKNAVTIIDNPIISGKKIIQSNELITAEQ